MNSIKSNHGSVLLLTLLISTLLAIIGISATTIATTDMMITNAFRSDKSAFYLAESGISHAREVLRAAGSLSFSKQLKIAAGDNNTLDKDKPRSDDVPIVDMNFAGGRYVVYLLNDSRDGREKLSDSNNTLIIRSIGMTSYGVKSMLEATVHKIELFSTPSSHNAALPGSITLLGRASTIAINMNKKSIFTGDEIKSCGGNIAPVFAVSDDVSAKNINDSIEKGHPKSYQTNNNDVVKNIQQTISAMKKSYDVDLDSVLGLQKLVSNLSKGADAIISKKIDSTEIDLGSKENMRIVLAQGDFTLKKNGAGILIVKGRLRIKGDVKYDGLIVAVGDGSVKIAGAGHVAVNGGLLISNINTPETGTDKELNTADDKPGAANFDMASSGSIAISMCSSNILKAASIIPPDIVAFCNETCSHVVDRLLQN